MSISSSTGFIRIKDKVPYQGKGVEALLDFLRKTMSSPDNKYAQKITMDVSLPYVQIEKLIPDDGEHEIVQLSLHDLIRAKSIIEFTAEEGLTPFQQMWEIFDVIQIEGLEVSHILVGDRAIFQKWLGVRIPLTRPLVFGIALQTDSELPADVFLVCGSPTKVSEPDELMMSVKGLCE